jgi:hypothetical protein
MLRREPLRTVTSRARGGSRENDLSGRGTISLLYFVLRSMFRRRDVSISLFILVDRLSGCVLGLLSLGPCYYCSTRPARAPL